MRIDNLCWSTQKRVCISIDDQLYQAYVKFKHQGVDHWAREYFRSQIGRGAIQNSNDAKMAIYSDLMKPSAFKCFSGSIPDQVDLEDI